MFCRALPLALVAQILLFSLQLHGQPPQQQVPPGLGFRLLTWQYRTSEVQILIASKKGEESKPKPILLFCQGSLPRPLIVVDTADGGVSGPLPFDAELLTTDYHVAVIAKPGIPAIASTRLLTPQFLFLDTASGLPPVAYMANDHLDYYAERNKAVLDMLYRNKWAKGKAVCVGHSQGARVALATALGCDRVGSLVLASFHAEGQLAAMVADYRMRGIPPRPDIHSEEELFAYVQEIMSASPENDYEKSIRSFSGSVLPLLSKFRKKPTLICYGTADPACASLDVLRIRIAQNNQSNVHFISYPRLDHNYFKIQADGTPDPEYFGWNNIANAWLAWLLSR